MIDDGVCGVLCFRKWNIRDKQYQDFDISNYLGNSKSLPISQITDISDVSESISSKVADIITGGVTRHQITIPIENMDGLWKQVGDFSITE